MAKDFKLIWRGKDVQKLVDTSAIDGLENASEALLDESNKIAPIDEGTLIRSGNTAIDEKNKTAAVFYDTQYAVRQHEDVTQKHSNGRQAKFLETAYKNNIDAIRNYIANAMKGKL